MKTISSDIDGISITLNKVETTFEYRNGARISGTNLKDTEGYIFEYSNAQKLQFENTGVPFDLRVLYLSNLAKVSSNELIGVVLEHADMSSDSCKVVSSQGSYFKIAIELKKDLCDLHNIGSGSIIKLTV